MTYYTHLDAVRNAKLCFPTFCPDFTDTSEYWTFPFEMYDFRDEMERVWTQIKPLYEQLHAYVRRKLRDLYGPEKISREAPLPAHILGETARIHKVIDGANARAQ